MAAAKKHSVEQIVAELREHEMLQGQGLTMSCKADRDLGPDLLSLAPDGRRIEGRSAVYSLS